jgi:hypothetical protein
MTNILQRDTTQLSLLAGVEPLAWANPYGGFISAKYKETLASGLEKQTHTLPLYSREHVLLAVSEELRDVGFLGAASFVRRLADQEGDERE